MKLKGIKYIFAGISLCAFLGCASSGTGANIYSKEQETEMGAKYAAQLNKELKIMSDPVLVGYVNQLGQKMVKQGLVNPEFDYKFHVVDSSEVNAFALPGGQVYINLALLKEAENEAEIIGVVGHELGHVVHHHGAKRMTDAVILETAAAIGAQVAGEKAGKYVGTGAMLFGQLGLLKYGRNAELEADQTGIDVLYRTGYDVQGLPGFFRKLERIQNEKGIKGGGLSEMLSTHPATADRIKQAEAAIAKLPPQQNPKVSSPEFEQIRKHIAPMKPSAPTTVKGGKT